MTLAQLPRPEMPVFDDSEQFPLLIGGAIDKQVLKDDAHEHGREVPIRHLGDRATGELVEIAPPQQAAEQVHPVHVPEVPNGHQS